MKNFRWILNILMLLSFLVLAVTGIVKFPELQSFFSSIFTYVPASSVSFLHDWSGIILVLLIIIHLFFNAKKLSATDESKYRAIKKSITIVLIVVLISALALMIFNIARKNQPIKLSSVEITDYSGEKLGSINDFRENSIKGPQYVNKDTYKLEVTGLVDNPASYSYDDVLKLPSYQKVVTINCVEGWSVKVLWEGILARDLFKDLGVGPEANTVIFYAVDGYSTSFPINYLMDNDILMAYKMNGVVLPPERGFPFQLVAEDKWGYKWIKWINKIEISSDSNYQGYWEQRGYNNNGDLNGSKFQ